jgi:preprotein translocase subunit SecG
MSILLQHYQTSHTWTNMSSTPSSSVVDLEICISRGGTKLIIFFFFLFFVYTIFVIIYTNNIYKYGKHNEN